jgi:hypothetical protein
MAVLGQVPDLREGDCVRALEDIDYEFMPKAKKGYRGMVTGKGIIWEGRHWQFDKSQSKQDENFPYLFKQRNAVIHRSMVEKMSETEGYGPIERDDGKCLTVFELDAKDDRKPQAPKLQWWDCEPGWAAQVFIYPACGLGPGQLRWATDPQMCAFRSPSPENQKLVLSRCEWTQPFIFAIVGDKATVPKNSGADKFNNPPNPDILQDDKNPPQDLHPKPGTATIEGFLKVGTLDTKEKVDDGSDPDPRNKDREPKCMKIPVDKPNIGHKDEQTKTTVDAACPEGKYRFPGLWHATDLDV